MGNNKEIAAKVEEEKAVTESKAEQPPVGETPPAITETATLTKAERIKQKAQAEINKWKQEAIERTPEPEEVEDEE